MRRHGCAYKCRACEHHPLRLRFRENRHDKQTASEAIQHGVLQRSVAFNVHPKWGTRLTQLVARNCNAAVEIVVGDPIEEVSGAKRGRIDHTMINQRACPRTCKHSFSAVIHRDGSALSIVGR
jgi:hypothetical protein